MKLDDKFDDTKSEYWDGTLKSYAPKSFDTVDLPKERWPDFNVWGWDVLMAIIWDFDGKYPEYVTGDIRRLFTRSERRLWLWNHFGNGDSVRISSLDSNSRLIVVFDHESERSPWANKDGEEGYAPGMDFISGLDHDEILSSEIFPFSQRTAAMTEVYRYRRSFDHFDFRDEQDMSDDLKKFLQERLDNNPDRIITSPEVLALGNDFSTDNEFGPINEDERKYMSERQITNRPRFLELYEQLVAGNLPTLRELHDLLQDDSVTAAAFDAMQQIHEHWIPTPEEQHRRWDERRKQRDGNG